MARPKGYGNGRSRDTYQGVTTTANYDRYGQLTCNAKPAAHRIPITRKRTKKTAMGPAGSTYFLFMEVGEVCGQTAIVTKAPGVHRCAAHLSL